MTNMSVFDTWYESLLERHQRDLTFQEIRKALQALSSVYVQKRNKINKGAALDSAGKRAAFALFYGPLHYLFTQAVLQELDSKPSSLREIVDLGCGTGVVGAAWSVLGGQNARVQGVDQNPWATKESQHTYRDFQVQGRARVSDLTKTKLPGSGAGIVAAYAVNELPDAKRERMLQTLLSAAKRGAKVIVIEPISTATVPWWPTWSSAFLAAGGRSDTWKFPTTLPEHLRLLDKATRMNHQVLKGRTLWLSPHGATQ